MVQIFFQRVGWQARHSYQIVFRFYIFWVVEGVSSTAGRRYLRATYPVFRFFFISYIIIVSIRSFQNLFILLTLFTCGLLWKRFSLCAPTHILNQVSIRVTYNEFETLIVSSITIPGSVYVNPVETVRAIIEISLDIDSENKTIYQRRLNKRLIP